MAREPTAAPPGGEPLLTRLLRRRAGEPAADAPARASGGEAGDTRAASGQGEAQAAAPAQCEDRTPPAPLPASRIDPDSGRPIDELVDADLPPIDSIGPDSDVRAFLGRNISPELRRQALRKLFHQPKFNTVCLCAEYAENYNNFTPMGSIVPHDLKRQLALQAERLAKRALEQESSAAAASAATGDAAPAGAQTVLQRDSDTASTKVLSGTDEAGPEALQPPEGQAQRG